MSKLKLLPLLLLALAAPSRSHAQAVIVGQPCGAGGLNAIATNGTPVVCTGNPLLWTSPSGSGSASPNLPIPANQAQGPQYNVVNYASPAGAIINDAQHIRDGVTAGGAKTITSASAHWQTNAKVGQKIVCGAAAGIGMSLTTIQTITSDTVVTTLATDNGAVSGLSCTWFTTDATASFVAAAAAAANTAGDPNNSATLGKPAAAGTVFCPEGGYAVSGALLAFAGSGSTISTSFVGSSGGRNTCIIYPIPGTSINTLITSNGAIGAVFANFAIDGSSTTFSTGAGNYMVGITGGSAQFLIENVKITNISASGTNGSTINIDSSSNGVLRNVFVQGGGSTSGDFACRFNAASTIVIDNITCSNHFQNLVVNGGGLRSVGGDNAPIFHGGIIDECGSVSDCAIFSNSGGGNFFGTSFMTGVAGINAINVDATSRLFLSNVSCGVFGSSTVQINCMTIASGGIVLASMSDLRGNDSNSTAGAAVNGPAGASFIDVGGNKIRHSVSGTITDVTPAQYGTLGFTGGIVPKATVTHTPNTCYAVTGNLLATAQNICTFLNDQNYQVLNITAQSGGTTPANSSCTGAPVITLSDGTRTATLTMTTGKTQWSSAVDASTVNSVFASGTTLTISIGANTCATPPVNVAVSYILQSVLNQ